MQISEVALAAAITVSIAGVSYAAFSPGELKEGTQVVADRATCRTATAAVLGYLAQHDTLPSTVADLKPFVDGDLTRYTIVNGKISGPGCA